MPAGWIGKTGSPASLPKTPAALDRVTLALPTRTATTAPVPSVAKDQHAGKAAGSAGKQRNTRNAMESKAQQTG
jgi:hypothetical protein